MKKLFAVCLVALLALTGCSKNGGSKAETFTGEGQGMGGVVTATVTIEDGKITKVEFVGENETPGISDPAFDEMPQKFIDAQSAEVDATSGCTVTSEAMMDAVADALSKAGL